MENVIGTKSNFNYIIKQWTMETLQKMYHIYKKVNSETYNGNIMQNIYNNKTTNDLKACYI